jgi:hypothetical protein
MTVHGRPAVAALICSLAVAACGGDEPDAPASAQKDPSELTAADLAKGGAFWSDQTPAGRETLAGICKAREGQAAEQQAIEAADSDPDADEADALASITAGRDAKTAVLEIDNRDLAGRIDKSVATAEGRTIGDACTDVVASATGPTSLDIDGADRESILGADTYVADPAARLTIRGTIEPAGDGMELELERRLADEWEYVESDPPGADGTFTLTLRAYRANSNLYRIKARGTGASQATTAEVYFDRP